jgi:hypothetical protein
MTSAIASWYAGTTRQVVTTVKDIQGELVDLTGANARFVMVKPLTGEMLVMKWTGDHGITLDIPNSKVTVDINPADTLFLTGDVELQLEIMLANGVVIMAYDVMVFLKKNYSNMAD